MIQKTFCVILAKIILHIGFCGAQYESIGLHFQNQYLDRTWLLSQ